MAGRFVSSLDGAKSADFEEGKGGRTGGDILGGNLFNYEVEQPALAMFSPSLQRREAFFECLVRLNGNVVEANFFCYFPRIYTENMPV